MEEYSSAKEETQNGSVGQMSSSQCCFLIDLFKAAVLKCLGLDQSNKMTGGGVSSSATSESKNDTKPSENDSQVSFERTSIITTPTTVPTITPTTTTTILGTELEAETTTTTTTTIAGTEREISPPTDASDDPPAPSVSTGSGPQIN